MLGDSSSVRKESPTIESALPEDGQADGQIGGRQVAKHATFCRRLEDGRQRERMRD